jgi:hypothetical protein
LKFPFKRWIKKAGQVIFKAFDQIEEHFPGHFGAEGLVDAGDRPALVEAEAAEALDRGAA